MEMKGKSPQGAPESRPKPDLPPLSRLAGAFLLASGFFALASLLAFGTFGRQTPYGFGFALGGFLCLSAWFLGRLNAKKWEDRAPSDAFSRQRALLGINSVTSVVLLGVLLIGANYLAKRHHKTFDLTRNRINSLSDQTRNTLEKLPAPVHLTYFSARQVNPDTRNLLDAYRRASGKISLDYVNALREPSRLPPSFNGTPLLVAQMEKTPSSTQEISVADEQNITSALLKLMNPQTPPLYFLSGHGEVVPRQIPELQNALGGQNYALKTLSLLQKPAVPADCAALIIMAPQVDLGPNEAKILTNYAPTSRGRMVFLLSPKRQKMPRFDGLLKTMGVQLENGFVFDPKQAYQDPQLPIGLRGDIRRHPILRGVSADCVFPGAIPIRDVAAPGFTALFLSSPASQAMGADGKPTRSGPFVLAAAIERERSRAVVCASASLATAEGLALFGNKSLVLSSVNWVVGNDALVSIPPKDALASTLQMSEATERFAMLFSILVMPLLVLGAGAIVWWQRR